MAERVSLDWARLEDDEPSTAVVDLGGVRPAERDWDGLDARLRDTLSRLWASPMIRNDPECRAIFEALLVERGGEALDRAATRLAARADALLAGRSTPAAPPPPGPPPSGPPPRPSSLLRSLFKL